MKQMLAKVFTVFDSKAVAYMSPFIEASTGTGIRRFSDEVNNTSNSRSALVAHPEDFTLFEIGTWDEIAGVVLPYEAKISRGVGVDYRREPEVASDVPRLVRQ